jgi:hypothetical protein
MKHESSEQLERYIDAELRRLPNVKAPKGLAAKVIGRIQLQRAPWWQAGWMHWPWSLRIAAVVVIGALSLYFVRSIVQLGAGWILAILAQETLHTLSDVWTWLSAVSHRTQPIRGWLQYNLTVLCILTPLVIGAGHVIWDFTLKDEK